MLTGTCSQNLSKTPCFTASPMNFFEKFIEMAAYRVNLDRFFSERGFAPWPSGNKLMKETKSMYNISVVDFYALRLWNKG